MKISRNRLALASIASAVAFVSVGHFFYYKVFAAFFAANLGSAIGVYREDPVGWAIMLAQVGLGTLITLTCAHLSWVLKIRHGMKAGAIIGLLVGVGFSFEMYGVTHVANLTATIVDTLLWVVKASIAGGVATWLLDKN